MGSVRFSEPSINLCHATLRRIPEEGILNDHSQICDVRSF